MTIKLLPNSRTGKFASIDVTDSLGSGPMSNADTDAYRQIW